MAQGEGGDGSNVPDPALGPKGGEGGEFRGNDASLDFANLGPPIQTEGTEKRSLELNGVRIELAAKRKQEEEEEEEEDEFGEVEAGLELLHEKPAVGMTSSLKEKLVSILAVKRHLRQFFVGETLYREKKRRRVSDDELFLDLVIVAIVAALSHEFRHHFESDGFDGVQEFFLIFQVVWSTWRDCAFKTNLFGVESDLLEKLNITLLMAALVSMGVSSSTAFTETIPWTAMSAFVLQFYTALSMVASGGFSRRLHSWNPCRNMVVAAGVAGMITSLPYLIAAIVNTEDTAKAMYWLGFVLSQIRTQLLPRLMRRIAEWSGQKVYVAVNIEVLTEKFALITLVTLGESFLTLLFAASNVVSSDRSGPILGTGILGLIITYSLMTLYFDVDQHLLNRAVHAVRKGYYRGITWAAIHVFYHASLLLGASSLGKVLEVASLGGEPSSHVLAGVDAVVRASSEEAAVNEFGSRWKWLLCGSYGCSMLLSALMGLTHAKGPYAVTQMGRYIARTVLVLLSILTLIPLSDSLSALGVLGTTAAVIAVITLVELVLVKCDRLCVWPWIDYSQTDTATISTSQSGGVEESDPIFKSRDYTERQAQECTQ